MVFDYGDFISYVPFLDLRLPSPVFMLRFRKNADFTFDLALLASFATCSVADMREQFLLRLESNFPTW